MLGVVAFLGLILLPYAACISLAAWLRFRRCPALRPSLRTLWLSVIVLMGCAIAIGVLAPAGPAFVLVLATIVLAIVLLTSMCLVIRSPVPIGLWFLATALAASVGQIGRVPGPLLDPFVILIGWHAIAGGLLMLWAAAFPFRPPPDPAKTCIHCGYSRDGLRAESVCPECGKANEAPT